MVIGILIGICLVPGGHFQFQFWFIFLVPLAIEMVGLPTVTTFWVYGYFYPVRIPIGEDLFDMHH